METVLILAAVAALAVSGMTVAAMAARSRRPPLRLPHEYGIERASEDGLIEDFERPVPSLIDRTGAVLDLEPIERPQPPGRDRIEAPHTCDVGRQPDGTPRHRRSDESR